jgi:hypothetical protein
MKHRNNMISFCVNTCKNELNHLKLLFKSFEKNLSTLDHEFIVFIDSDNQNTFEWLLSQKSIFHNLKILRNTQIPYSNSTGQNIMFGEAKNEIVSYLQSDMVICKNYDLEILSKLEKNMLLCSTRIEPSLHGNSGEKITKDFSLTPIDFDLESFTQFAESVKEDRLIEYYFAPYTMYKNVWLSIGGHDIQFRRSREDSDIYTRLLIDGVTVVQTWKALVYHFTCTSSRGLDWYNQNNPQARNRVELQNIADNFELAKIMRKWGKFNHSNVKTKYYEISAIVKGDIKNNKDKVLNIEPFFNKIYFEDEFAIEYIFDRYDTESQKPANELMGIKPDQWKEFKYLFQKDIVKERMFKLSNSVQDDIEISFSIDNISNDDIYNFIQKLQDIIDSVDDVGNYEYGAFNINIRNKIDKAHKNIVVDNPKISEDHMYTIH